MEGHSTPNTRREMGASLNKPETEFKEYAKKGDKDFKQINADINDLNKKVSTIADKIKTGNYYNLASRFNVSAPTGR